MLNVLETFREKQNKSRYRAMSEEIASCKNMCSEVMSTALPLRYAYSCTRRQLASLALLAMGPTAHANYQICLEFRSPGIQRTTEKSALGRLAVLGVQASYDDRKISPQLSRIAVPKLPKMPVTQFCSEAGQATAVCSSTCMEAPVDIGEQPSIRL